MKQFILSLAIATFSLSSFASTGMKPDFKAGKSIAAPYKRLVVYGNLKVILVNADEKQVSIHDQIGQTKVNALYSKNELIIDGSAVDEFSPVTVRVPVNQLELLEINGIASVISENTLQLNHLTVSMQGEGKIDIKNTGSIKVKSDNGIQFKTIKQKGQVTIH